MSVKTSKEVTDRQKSCDFLLSAFNRQGEEVYERLLETVRPLLGEGEAEPVFQTTINALAHRLVEASTELVRLDEAVYDKNARLDEARKKRDKDIQALASKVSRLRLSIENQYQAPKVALLGFESPMTRSHFPLLRQAQRVVAALGQEDLATLLGPADDPQPFDPTSSRDGLVAMIEKLRGVLRQVNEVQRDFDRALIDKQAAMKKHDEVFLHTARTFEAFCRLAEETELANRVRPSLRRPGRFENLEDGKAGDDAKGDDETANDNARQDDAGAGQDGSGGADGGGADGGGEGSLEGDLADNDNQSPPRDQALVS